jgi:hypothetical protein
MACVEYLTKYENNFSKLVEYMEKKEAEIKEREQKTKVTPDQEQNKEPSL